MEISTRFWAFLLFCSLIISLSLFLFNDLMTIWGGAEASWLSASLSEEGTSFLPLAIMKLLAQTQENFPFVPRVTGAVLFLASVLGFYYIAKPFLGKMVVMLTALLLGAGFLIPVLSKIATLDIWNFAFHFLVYFSMIRFLKQPKLEWRLMFYGLFALSILVQPVSALIFVLGSSTLLWWKHNEGSRLVSLNPWIFGTVITLVFHFAGLLSWKNDWQIFSAYGNDIKQYLLYNLIGVLPFIGFWAGGLRDLVYKLRRNEELAIITASLIVFAFLAQSPVIQVGFAFISAKQMLVFQQENYPFKNWVRTVTILNLILGFVLSVFLMLGGMAEFGGIGFRSGLIFSFMYWAIGIVAVIGMYGGQKRFIIGGPVASGVLCMFIFWMQLYPLIESKRNIPRRAVEHIEKISEQNDLEKIFISNSEKGKTSGFYVHTKHAFPNLEIIEDQANSVKDAWAKSNNSILINKENVEADSPQDSTLLIGWNDRLESEAWSINTK